MTSKQTVATELKNAFIRSLLNSHQVFINNAIRGVKSFTGPRFLPTALRTTLPGIIIDFRPLPGKWGQWCPQERLIVLNEELLHEDYWMEARGILAHETIHQLVSDLFPYASKIEPPHGVLFMQVAQFTETDPFYWKAKISFTGPTIPPSPYGKKREEAENHPILNKVKKLLSLASSTTHQHESQTALSAAERLLTKYNLETPVFDNEHNEPYERWTIPLNGKITFQHNNILCIIKKFFYVYPLFAYRYSLTRQEEYKVIELVGKPVNLALAEHVYYFLMERCETLWLDFKPKALAMGEKGLSAKNSFIRSLLKAFSNKMSSEQENYQKQETTTGSRELIENSKTSLSNYVNYIYPKLGTHSVSSQTYSPGSAEAGSRAGNNLSIYMPVNNKTVVTNLTLPSGKND
ncbi:MAG: DUF2786 domain-containing protein [Deltaproteobacteria bacterium]|jgi:hypothetical protein|nr:DUF2786 domain-containing protein [Deltaproteobacteria bacterium]